MPVHEHRVDISAGSAGDHAAEGNQNSRSAQPGGAAAIAGGVQQHAAGIFAGVDHCADDRAASRASAPGAGSKGSEAGIDIQGVESTGESVGTPFAKNGSTG